MKFTPLKWLFIPVLIVIFSFDIVRRHDKPDQAYLDLGANFPSVCKVGKRGGDGTLIGPRWVVTAAHVARGMFNREGENLEVYFQGTFKGIRVDKVFIHPNFQPMSGADVGLLYLAEEVTEIKPASLYQDKDEQGRDIVIVGHGDARTGLGGDWVADGRRRGATNVIDAVNADKIIFDFDEPGEGTELEGTAGPGDSGGPAFILVDEEPVIVGISSAGMPGANGPGTYGAQEFYTRLSAYVDWVISTMKNPSDKLALKGQVRQSQSAGKRVVTGRPQGGPLPGLGLMLRQEGDKIRIGGKADPRVPQEFRHVMFKPPSYLAAFNNKKYDSLERFIEDFEKLDKGGLFQIKFIIQGKEMVFEAKKM